MRLAFVDLLFSWPPHGGADVDCYHTVNALRKAGHVVHLFVLHNPDSWERGACVPTGLPFPTTLLPMPLRPAQRRGTCQEIRQAVDLFAPDLVFVNDGFFLKPWVIEALRGLPTVARYYAYEMACHKDILRFLDGAPCDKHYLRTPEICRVCAASHQKPDITSGRPLAWTEEYLLAEAYSPEYHALSTQALASLAAAIVYNPLMAACLKEYAACVTIIPGGVDLDDFPYSEPQSKQPDAPKVILMTGRAEDPAKGLHTLKSAAAQLWQRRKDFEVCVTLPHEAPSQPWFRTLGWCDHRELRGLYQHADIVVVPSTWDEPFGLVALEAMATGRPVCASKVGGLESTVRAGETGLHFEREDAQALAAVLERLLDSESLRREMGRAGRRCAETNYAWDVIVKNHYEPLIARLAANAGPTA